MAIGDYIDKHNNGNPKPFVWTAKATDILEKAKRARKALDIGQSGCRTTLVAWLSGYHNSLNPNCMLRARLEFVEETVARVKVPKSAFSGLLLNAWRLCM